MRRVMLFRYLLVWGVVLIATARLAADEPIPPVVVQALRDAGAIVWEREEGIVPIQGHDLKQDQLEAVLKTLPKIVGHTNACLALNQFDPALIEKLVPQADLLSRLAAVEIAIEANVTDAQVCQLSKIKNLRRLALQWDQPIEAGDKGLACLADNVLLEQLRLDHSRITDDGLRHLKNLSKLRFLTLWHTRIDGEGFAHLKDSPIDVLMLNGSDVSDLGLQHIGQMRSVRRLLLNEVPINGDGLKYLGRSSPLQSLGLLGTNIMDDSLKHLVEVRTLKSLSLSDCPITDAAIPHLSKMRHLKDLSILGTKITAEGFQKLKQTLPGVEILY